MVYARIKGIEYYLPDRVVKNNRENKTVKKIGIFQKHIAAEDEFASDLAVNAAKKLLEHLDINPKDIDYILYCTQSPDYYLPTTACLIQNRLGVKTSAGALDFNLGCSGYVYGLSMAKGLIESGQVKNVLLLTGETYSKFINPKDRSVELLFGDAGSATFIEASEVKGLEGFAFGTDGSGGNNLIVPAGGLRQKLNEKSLIEVTDEFGNTRSNANLYMSGAEVFNFTLREIPPTVNQFLEVNNLNFDDFNKVIFHQANQHMLKFLRKKMNIPEELFSIHLEDCGNTVSSSIPIALKREIDSGKVKDGDHILVVGFGVGFSWAVGSFFY
ncbi:ketoacyl-ACP synthase III [Fredinandcohnia sp. QZ13]|uniref:ketoacyl-ACP synthase III n=1 Tax=Fredinandcohnia sp. QZ13 TaxID=3073144 RepID=UPI00285318B0|nr:ketoacyl-ACP synthase III [Fredinandcohnia sp. QZ13]MDR4889985.1 ketoacyl-ACP synthase III [Fredinandcohnia sp. QZ13]